MIIQTPGHRYEVKKSRTVTHETFTKRYALDRLETKLKKALQEQESYRQREKVKRLERQIDKLKLEISV